MAREKLTRELSDDELVSVIGGVKTGDMDGEKVYIEFPAILASWSGYYSRQEIEQLCIDYASWSSLIKMYLNSDVKNAVKKLYGSDPIPTSVKNVLGL